MDITILICTFKSSSKIQETLFHLKKQINTEKIKWEVVVVDYFSNDNLEESIKNIWQNFVVPIKVEFINESGKTPALERGLLISKGKAICIIDDDNHVDKNYINIANDVIKNNPSVGIVGAFGIPKSDKILPNWFYDYQDYFAVGHQSKETGILIDDKKKWFWGAGSVIRKEAWEKAKKKGFNPIFNPSRASNNINFENGFSGGEDPELCYAIQLVGYNLWYEPNLIYHHFIPENRLSLNYIENTIYGTAKSQVILRIYSAYLLNTRNLISAIKFLVFTNWYAHFMYIFLIKKLHQNMNKLEILSFNLQLNALKEIKRNYKSLKTKIKKLND
jgi:glycosyltransferase involved in cell wall biosynthesis